MTNRFKHLDEIFPCTPLRVMGEVVSVSIQVQFYDQKVVLSHKRKAWYVNASVNAWHLHRGLCKDFKDSGLSSAVGDDIRLYKKLLGDIVDTCYQAAAHTGQQYFEAFLGIGVSAVEFNEFSSDCPVVNLGHESILLKV